MKFKLTFFNRHGNKTRDVFLVEEISFFLSFYPIFKILYSLNLRNIAFCNACPQWFFYSYDSFQV